MASPEASRSFLCKTKHIKQSCNSRSLSLSVQKHLHGVTHIFHSDITDGLDTPV